jgi:GTP cyclohydrolase I
MDTKKIEKGIRLVLEGIGEDPARPGIAETPRRYAEFCREFFTDPTEPAAEVIRPVAGEKHNEMVTLKDLSFFSFCEHHLLPFMGRAHIAYIPRGGRIVGLGNLGRLLESLAHRLQVQERLTTQLADTIMTSLNPLGTMVVIEGRHLCLAMRGVKQLHSRTVTSAVRGIFKTNPTTRSEFMSLLSLPGVRHDD